MIKTLLAEKQISAYKLAKDTGIPYSTISDLVTGKILIENTSSNTLFRLASYFDMSMDSLYKGDISQDKLYLSNRGREVIIRYKKQTIKYKGPKNLVRFVNINEINNGVLSVQTIFLNEDREEYSEEDYIDLMDLSDEFSMGLDINKMPEIVIRYDNTITKENIIDKAIMVCDYMAICRANNSAEDMELKIYNLNRLHKQMLLRLVDYSVLSTNMSDNMQERALSVVIRNRELIDEILKERNYA